MSAASLPAREQGTVLVVGLVMLTVITVLATSAFTMSASNVRVVGNQQFRSEAIAAANIALERVIASPFATSPSADEILVDIDKDGDGDYRVLVDRPMCIRGDAIVVTGAAPSSVLLGQRFAVMGSTFFQTVWDLNARVVDEITGASVHVRQGVSVLLSQSQFGAACP